jgi:hypothetical protein
MIPYSSMLATTSAMTPNHADNFAIAFSRANEALTLLVSELTVKETSLHFRESIGNGAGNRGQRSVCRTNSDADGG